MTTAWHFMCFQSLCVPWAYRKSHQNIPFLHISSFFLMARALLNFLTIITLRNDVMHFKKILANGKLVFSDMCLSNSQWWNTNVNTISWECISATGRQERREGERVADNFGRKIWGIHFKVAFFSLRLVHPAGQCITITLGGCKQTFLAVLSVCSWWI